MERDKFDLKIGAEVFPSQTTTSIPKEKWGVHETHCCVTYGCKYGHDDCPVYLRLTEQRHACMDCDYMTECHFKIKGKY